MDNIVIAADALTSIIRYSQEDAFKYRCFNYLKVNFMYAMILLIMISLLKKVEIYLTNNYTTLKVFVKHIFFNVKSKWENCYKIQ